MKLGDTFRITAAGRNLDRHLWIVLSDPSIDDQNVLIVNLTSWRADKDQACILDRGDHAFVEHRTCVNYAEAKVQRLSTLDSIRQAGQMCDEGTLDSDVLGRVLEGAAQSTMMDLGKADILIGQELI